MGLFDDILKGLPVNPLLREKIAELEAKFAATETENAILKDDLRDAKAENQELKKQVEELTHQDDLNKLEILLIQLLADSTVDHDLESLSSGLNEHPARISYHLQRLADLDYVECGVSLLGEPVPYDLTNKVASIL